MQEIMGWQWHQLLLVLLRKKYGDTTVKELQDLENCQHKLSHHRNHLVYLVAIEQASWHLQRWGSLQPTNDL